MHFGALRFQTVQLLKFSNLMGDKGFWYEEEKTFFGIGIRW